MMNAEPETTDQLTKGDVMEFSSDKILEKYIRLREQVVDPYVPDFDTADDEIRYIRFNDHWRGLNPYSKFLLPRLTDNKNTYPKVPSKKIAKNANPDNYVTLNYDRDGRLRMARLGRYQDSVHAVVYVSEQLSIEYTLYDDPDHEPPYSMTDFEWYEYDDLGRIVSAQSFRCAGSPSDDVVINCEYYEYDGDMLSHAWEFKDFNRYPMQMTVSFVLRAMPDRIYNPDRIEYSFSRTDDGLSYIRNHYYRKSQTITHEEQISEKTLQHLAENGFRLV